MQDFAKYGWRGTLFNILKNVILTPLRSPKTRSIESHRIRMAQELVYKKNIKTRHGELSFLCHNELLLWRAETLLVKESETIDWIDSMQANETLWDIGANIGCYSLYAALRGLSVTSFEPIAKNYALLCEHATLNGLEQKIISFCLALDNQSSIGKIDLTTCEAGGAISFYGGNGADFVCDGILRNVVSQQGVMAISIDELIAKYDLSCPNHIKIDVDGLESRILQGAQRTLANSVLKSILVEVDFSDMARVTQMKSILQESGFSESFSPQTGNETTVNIIFKRD